MHAGAVPTIGSFGTPRRRAQTVEARACAGRFLLNRAYPRGLADRRATSQQLALDGALNRFHRGALSALDGAAVPGTVEIEPSVMITPAPGSKPPGVGTLRSSLGGSLFAPRTWNAR